MGAFVATAWRYLTILCLIASAMLGCVARAEVYADDPNPNDPSRAVIVATATDLAPIAKEFGCAFAWGQLMNETSATFEFVPRGDDVRKWTRLVTITTIALPAEAPAQTQLMLKLHSITLQKFDGRGSVRAQKLGENPKGMPALYFEYEIGEGAQTEFGAVGVYKVRSAMAAIVQIQSHKPLAREDAAKMSALALPAAQH